MGGIKDGVRLKNEFGEVGAGNKDGAEVCAEIRNGNGEEMDWELQGEAG